MAVTVNIHEAKTRLSQLVARAASGEDVIIAKAGKPLVRLVRFAPAGGGNLIGFAKGRIQISEDFDAPLTEFEDLD